MALLAIFGFGIAIYQGFFYERRGDISIFVDQPSRVYDLRQSVGGLDIFYGGENLKSTKKTLWIVGVTIKNTGNAEIRKSDFDDASPLALIIIDGDVVEAPSIRTSNSYLEEALKVNFDRQRISLGPSILEPEDFININLLILGPENVNPKVLVSGKIAGIREFTVSKIETGKVATSWWQKIADAEAWWVHPARALVYSIGAILSIGLFASLAAGLVIPIESLSARRQVEIRRGKVDKYKHGDNISKELRLLQNIYIRDGDISIYRIQGAINQLERRANLHNFLIEKMAEEELRSALKRIYPINIRVAALISELIAYGVISVNGLKRDVSDKLKDELLGLMDYLELDKGQKLSELDETMAPAALDHRFIADFSKYSEET